MGLIYKDDVKETKIYQAYGLSVYGEIHGYEWTIDNYRRENVLTTIRITDNSDNDIFSMYLGNNCIFLSAIEDGRMDDFLFWIVECPEECQDKYDFKKQVRNSLCAGNSIFNHRIQQLKMQKKEEEKRKEKIAREEAKKDSIRKYCKEHDLIPFFTYCDDIYIIKPYNEKAAKLFETVEYEHKERLIDFMKEYPDNKDARIVKEGKLESILNFIA